MAIRSNKINRYRIDDYSSRNISVALEWQAETNADQLWLWESDRQLSFGEANDLVNRYARGLEKLGVQHGDIVAMVMHPSIEVVLVGFAIARLGATFTTINTDFKGAFLNEALEDTGASVLVVDPQIVERLAELDVRAQIKHIYVNDAVGADPDLCPLGDLLEDEPYQFDASKQHWRDIVQIWWSSGTTGKSKGVMFSHSHLANLADRYGSKYIAGDSVLHSVMPMYLGAAWVSIIYPSLFYGVVAAIDEKFSVSGFWERVRFYGATNIHTLGAMHMLLWKQAPSEQDLENTARFAYMIPTPHDLIPKFKQRWGLTNIPQAYGTSETYTVFEAPDDGTKWGGSAIGYPVPHLDVKLVDDDDQEVAAGEVGEICVRPKVPGVMFSGYFKQPQRTLDTYRDLWYHTGDMAIRDEDGIFHFADRKKDYIRYKGRSISNFEVEEVVYKHEAVADVAAFGIQSEELKSEQELAIHVIIRPGMTLDFETLARFINENAPYYFVPRFIKFVTDIPRNAHGRTLKTELTEQGVTPGTWDRMDSDFEIIR